MTNVLPRNAKLRARALRILMAETGIAEETAHAALAGADGDLRTALVMIKSGHSLAEAKSALEASGGVIEQAIHTLQGR